MAKSESVPNRMVSLPTPPASPEAGWVYFDTTLNKKRVYDGTGWVTIG